MPGVCPAHGPYNGANCPYPPPHGDYANRPADPGNLNDDDIVTDYGAQPMSGGGQGGGFNEDDVVTEIPGGGKGRILDAEDEQETELGRQKLEDETELADPVRPTLGMLWVKEGKRIGKFYPLRDGTVVGRKYNKEGDLILDEPKVSSMHAKFKMEDGLFVVWDLGSTNGTYVNGHKIREATILEENDLVQIGDTVFVVKLLISKPPRKSSVRKTAKKVKAAD